MQRYFAKEIKDNEFILIDDDIRHIKKVMRMNDYDEIIVVYENNPYLCYILNEEYEKIKIKEEIKKEEEFIPNITLIVPILKEQKMDYILQKTTELGVDKIIPVIANRSVVKLNDKREKKIVRWQTIVKEASEQSKRKNIPSVLNFHNIENLIDLNYDHKILCTVNEVSTTLKTVLQNVNNDDTILVVIGPEGGFTKEEERILIESGFVSTSLGNRVLRTETASLFLLSIINYIYMR